MACLLATIFFCDPALGLDASSTGVALHGGGRSHAGPYTAESTIGEPYATLRCDAGSIDLRLGYLAATESEWIIPCPADISNDGDVSVVDLLILLDAWGTNGPLGDVNYDGIVDTNDILLVLSAWGPCP